MSVQRRGKSAGVWLNVALALIAAASLAFVLYQHVESGSQHPKVTFSTWTRATLVPLEDLSDPLLPGTSTSGSISTDDPFFDSLPDDPSDHPEKAAANFLSDFLAQQEFRWTTFVDVTNSGNVAATNVSIAVGPTPQTARSLQQETRVAGVASGSERCDWSTDVRDVARVGCDRLSPGRSVHMVVDRFPDVDRYLVYELTQANELIELWNATQVASECPAGGGVSFSVFVDTFGTGPDFVLGWIPPPEVDVTHDDGVGERIEPPFYELSGQVAAEVGLWDINPFCLAPGDE